MSSYSRLDRPPLHAGDLRRALLRDEGFWTELRVLARTESTNADVVSAAQSGVAEGLVVFADEQTAGKGRLGREWVSPPRDGLAISVLLRPGGLLLSGSSSNEPVRQARWGWLPLLAGVAVTRAVAELGQVETAVKWPNDLLLGPERRKAGGILTEVVAPATPETIDQLAPAVVLGIGLNVTNTESELPSPQATSLILEKSACIDREPLLKSLLRALAADYLTWRNNNGDPEASGLRTEYRESCATLGRQVRVELPQGNSIVGTAVDIDSDGRLIVTSADGTTAVAAGDVIHVR